MLISRHAGAYSSVRMPPVDALRCILPLSLSAEVSESAEASDTAASFGKVAEQKVSATRSNGH